MPPTKTTLDKSTMFSPLFDDETILSPAAWVIIVASMTNVACGILGCFLVLRRMSLLGDALAHAVLPGLVLAFLLSGSLSIGVMFAGALAVGLLTSVLTQVVHRHGGVHADASMGVVFTTLFALGVVLVRRYASQVHIDTECVLEGLLDYVGVAGMNSVRIAGWEIPRQFVSILPVLFINIGFLLVFWKELKISSFDPALASTMGIQADVMHYLLMALVALTAVASFEAVGSILVVAMLIVPGATAHLLCDRLGWMVTVAAGVAIVNAVLGYWLAVWADANTAGMMATLGGGIYVAAVFFSPRHGVLSVLARRVRHSLRILCEDILAMLYRLDELPSRPSLSASDAMHAVGGGVLARWGLASLVRAGHVARAAHGLELTGDGRSIAQRLVRSHRLWETYLVQQLGLPLDHVHDPAERMEHFIDERLQAQLADQLRETSTDPHGRDIPGPDTGDEQTSGGRTER